MLSGTPACSLFSNKSLFVNIRLARAIRVRTAPYKGTAMYTIPGLDVVSDAAAGGGVGVPLAVRIDEGGSQLVCERDA